MVDVKISELPVAGSAAGTDQLEANQAGTSRSITVAQVGTALALTGYAPLASPVFTGDPQAPTPATADNDTSVATTAYVKAQGYLTTATAGTTYLPLTGGTLNSPGTLNGTVANFNNTVSITTADFSNFRVAGATKGVRFTPSSTAFRIEAVDQTWVGSFQPLTLSGSVVNVDVPFTGTSATFSGTVSAPGAQIQMVNVQTGAVATGTTTVPADDTIPQITEGNEYMTLAITPKSATSKLHIQVTAHLTHSVAGGTTVAALFQDATANALAASVGVLATAAGIGIFTFSHVMTSGTTSSTTFRVRAGSSVAGTTTFNGTGGARFYGGVMASSIVIREVV